jgi:hypothetical protein
MGERTLNTNRLPWLAAHDTHANNTYTLLLRVTPSLTQDEHAIQHPAHPHASVAPASARGEKGLDALRPPLVALHGPRVPLVRVVVVLARLRAAHLLSLPLLLLLALLNPAQVTQPQQPLGRAHVEEAAGGPKKLQDVP